MHPSSNITCIILCGGKSSRMGRDKAFIPYHGMPQYLHLKNMTKSLCQDTCFSINDSQEHLFNGENYIVDKYHFHGPLNGLLSAFDAYPLSHVLLLGVDYPLLKIDDLTALVANKEDHCDAVCYYHPEENIAEPLVALYDARCAAKLHNYVEKDMRPSIQGFLKSANVKKINLVKPHNMVSFDCE